MALEELILKNFFLKSYPKLVKNMGKKRNLLFANKVLLKHSHTHFNWEEPET